jgi:arylsulfatase A-like enzyme
LVLLKKNPNQTFYLLQLMISNLELGCYGNKLIKTPNIDRLASMGTVFMNNYCQQAVCGPTRASLMTGMRPDATKVWDLKTKMRDVVPNILTLPEYLISQGYITSGVGKIYHPSCVDKKNDEVSWSISF